MNSNISWNREMRYRPYTDWSSDYLDKLKQTIKRSPWRMGYHIQPETGLLNDPNGFSYFNGEWHLFYQHYPFGPVHGLKSWFHVSSTNLIDWHNKGTAILPDTSMDSHGAYSGSALPLENELLLAYTGNVRDTDWERESYQLGSTMTTDGTIHKKEQSLIPSPPEGYTTHFRDPQLVKRDGHYVIYIGAQTFDEQGKVLTYESSDLENWSLTGELSFTDEAMGYMIECPNLVFSNDRPVLIFCPQGLDKTTLDYQNIYPNTYVIGAHYDAQNHQIVDPSKLHLLDHGFDLYATQAFQSPDDRLLSIGWMGLPEMDYPSDAEGWAHHLSLVKELEIKDNHLYQRPVRELLDLRGDKLAEKTATHTEIDCEANQYELIVDFKNNQKGKITLASDSDHAHGFKISFDTTRGIMTIDRSNMSHHFSTAYGETRTCPIPDEVVTLRIFVDRSSVEIFVNDGYEVLSSRIFPLEDQTHLMIDAAKNSEMALWQLRNMNME